MKVIYMAHPVSGDIARNLSEAKRWIRWIEETHDDVAVVANWITECEIWDDSDPVQRAAGLRRDFAVIARCDELWLVGDHVSAGMRAEREHAEHCGLPVIDYTVNAFQSDLCRRD